MSSEWVNEYLHFDDYMNMELYYNVAKLVSSEWVNYILFTMFDKLVSSEWVNELYYLQCLMN